MSGALPKVTEASRCRCRDETKASGVIDHGQRNVLLGFRRDRRLCERGSCHCRCCIALGNRSVHTERSSVILSRQTSHKNRCRLYRSHTSTWKFAVADLLLNMVLCVPASVASSSDVTPSRGGRPNLATAATDISQKLNRPGSDVNSTAATVFVADQRLINSSGVPREAFRPTVTVAGKHDDPKSLIGDKRSHEPLHASQGLDVFAESMRRMSGYDGVLLHHLDAGDLAAVSKNRIVVRREAVLENGTAQADPPTASIENNASPSVPDQAATPQASDNNRSSDASPINPSDNPTTLSETLEDSTTVQQTSTQSGEAKVEDLSEMLRKAIEAAFATDETYPEDETTLTSQTTVSEESSTMSSEYTTTKKSEASFTWTTPAHEQTSETALGHSETSTSITGVVQPDKLTTAAASSTATSPAEIGQTAGTSGTASTPTKALSTSSSNVTTSVNNFTAFLPVSEAVSNAPASSVISDTGGSTTQGATTEALVSYSLTPTTVQPDKLTTLPALSSAIPGISNTTGAPGTASATMQPLITSHDTITASASNFTAFMPVGEATSVLPVSSVTSDAGDSTTQSATSAASVSFTATPTTVEPSKATTLAALSTATPSSGFSDTTAAPGTESTPANALSTSSENVTASVTSYTAHMPLSEAVSNLPVSSVTSDIEGSTAQRATTEAPVSYSTTSILQLTSTSAAPLATFARSSLSTAADVAVISTAATTTAHATTQFVPVASGSLSTSAQPNATFLVTSPTSSATPIGEDTLSSTAALGKATTFVALNVSVDGQTTVPAIQSASTFLGNATSLSSLPFSSTSLASGITSDRSALASSLATSVHTSGSTFTSSAAGEAVAISTRSAGNSTETDIATSSANPVLSQVTNASNALETTSEQWHSAMPSTTSITEHDSNSSATIASSTGLSSLGSDMLSPITTSAITAVNNTTDAAFNTTTVALTQSAFVPSASENSTVTPSASVTASSTTVFAKYSSTPSTIDNITVILTATVTSSKVHSLAPESNQSEPVGPVKTNEFTTAAVSATTVEASSNTNQPYVGAASQARTSGSAVGELLAWAIPVAVLGAVAVIGVIIAIAFIRKRRGSLWLHRGGRSASGSAAEACTGEVDSP